MWSPGLTIEDMEREAIQMAFRFYGRNKTTTASALGICVRTLDTKLEKYAAEEAEKLAGSASKDGGQPRVGVYGITTAELAAKDAQGGLRPFAGVQVESSAELPEKLSVPVQERQEVQKVLPAKAAKGGR